ncbi:LysR family transcriptional regulator [Variovorax sp. LjRoot178]|uniref:LysR family transcriptional regulator n=1 Tax=Variovorax sp. LjRoot178 TaxID=3342277 RepID=UPI003ED12DD8
MVDLNELRVFAYVVALDSFSKAAEALSIHRSSASRMVARLERELDCQLFVHPARKVRLTDEGQRLYEKCAEMLADPRS